MSSEHTQRELVLLRRFEPQVRFTSGESFFPMQVEPYIAASSLWMQPPEGDAVCLVPQGELTAENLCEHRQHGADVVYYLRFIEPLDILKLVDYFRQRITRRFRKGNPHDTFYRGFGRLARVGYSSRVADLLFSLSLLLRGRVPGDASAAAIMEYSHILDTNEHYAYYGRVLEHQGWTVLQYWFFYAFNNWRSGFFGINDHEADWEVINIYLYRTPDGDLQPEWIAYSAHDFSGDDLRRRWDDPELQKVGEHPVVYVGAGSHASYFNAGEYLAELPIPLLSPLARFARWADATWQKIQGRSTSSRDSIVKPDMFKVPFVDYARGDGFCLGPGGEKDWTDRILLDKVPDWISQYHGLWGLYARDPISGENAPAGPMYNRDGGIRQSWCDPLGWAGLDKIPPPDRLLESLAAEKASIQAQLDQNDRAIAEKSEELTRLGVISTTIHDLSHLKNMASATNTKIAELSNDLTALHIQKASSSKLMDALEHFEKRIRSGDRGPARAHIHRSHQPASASELRFSGLVELWAAISIGLMMIGFVALVIFSRQHLILGLVVLITVFVFLESGFRRQLDRLVNSLAIGLAIVSLLVVIFHFFWQIVVFLVLLSGLYILWENIREISGL